MSPKRIIQYSWLATRDVMGLKYPEHFSNTHLSAALDWLSQAQDVTSDKGVAAYYSLFKGWAPSFIETTGYIISTFLIADSLFPQKRLSNRAVQMADFLLDMQLSNGGFRTYPPNQLTHSPPTIFNTGQDLLGLCDIFAFTRDKKYLSAARRAADFLLDYQDSDGAWREFEVDQAGHTYHSRVGWALLKVGRLTQLARYTQGGIRSLDWVCKQQQANGWFDKSGLVGQTEQDPITHTIAYTLEGLFYGGLELQDARYVWAAVKAAHGIFANYAFGNHYSATFNNQWQPTSQYECLTGTAQLATLAWDMYLLIGDQKYLEVARKLTSHLKSHHPVQSSFSEIQGSMAGCLPTWGTFNGKGYCRFSQLNWATKFFADCLLSQVRADNFPPKGMNV